MSETVHHICGLGELDQAPLDSARRIISILEPEAIVPPELRALPNVLTLRFDDVIVDEAPYHAPQRVHIEALLAFDRDSAPGDLLVIHCTAGISRSTAAFVALLAQRTPGSEGAIFEQLRAIRPEAWPNSRMIALADDVLGTGGRLSHALRDHYQVQLRTFPYIGRMMIGLGREAEVPFDRLRPGKD